MNRLLCLLPEVSLKVQFLALYFSAYIFLCFKFLKHNEYADDVQGHISEKPAKVPEKISNANLDLEAVSKWSILNSLFANPKKCQAILIGSSKALSKVDFASLPKLTICGSEIIWQPVVKNLGLFMDQHLRWDAHVSHVCRIVYFKFRSLNRFKKFLSPKVKLRIVKTLILPIIDYCNVVYTSISVNLQARINRLINSCVRFVVGKSKFDHISEERKKLGIANWQLRSKLHLGHLIYRVNESKQPAYLFNKLVHFEHVYDTRGNDLFVLPARKTVLFSKSFSCLAPELWNSLPEGLRMSKSIGIFKNKLESYLNNGMT